MHYQSYKNAPVAAFGAGCWGVASSHLLMHLDPSPHHHIRTSPSDVPSSHALQFRIPLYEASQIGDTWFHSQASVSQT